VGVALGVGLVAVQHGHAIEPRPEPRERLRRQADLGHQDDRLAAETDDFPRGLKIDLGLAAAGHAVDENRLVAAAIECRENHAQRRLLVGVEREVRFARVRRLVVGPVHVDAIAPGHDQFLLA